MPILTDKLRQGIEFEERFVEVISNDIQQLEAFAELGDDTKEQIVKLLGIMRDDSAKHERLLQAIYDKY